MIQFKNIKISKRVIEEGVTQPFIYFEDARGRDWYTLRDKTWQGETAFIAVSPDGFIITGARDPNFMTLSEGVSIYEVAAADYHDDIGVKPYRYEKGKIIACVPSESEKAGIRKTVLLDQATTAIAPLQDAVELDMATEEETAQLLAWKKYRVLLNRTDTATAPDIDWPEMPVTV
jgi:hypothetical protein